MTYPDPTVNNLIKYLIELVEMRPETGEYTVEFERDGYWHGTSFIFDEYKTLQLEGPD